MPWFALSHAETAQATGVAPWPLTVLVVLVMLFGATAFGWAARISFREGEKLIAFTLGGAAAIFALGAVAFVLTAFGVGA